MVTLSRVCLRGGDSHLIELISGKIREAVLSQTTLLGGGGGQQGPLYAIFENFIATKVRETVARVNIDRSAVQEFIVYKDDKEEEQKAKEPAAGSVLTVEKEVGDKGIKKDATLESNTLRNKDDQPANVRINFCQE